MKRLEGTPAAAESHLDADLLTAYAEHSLAGRERTFVVEHLAHCRDCRDVVAIASSAIESTSQTDFRSPSINTARTPWFAWPALRWGVVAAGILVVASIGVVQLGYQRQSTTVVSNSLRGEIPVGGSLVATAPHAQELTQENERRKEALNNPALPIVSGKSRAQRNQRQLLEPANGSTVPHLPTRNSEIVVDTNEGTSAEPDQLAQNQVDLPPSVPTTNFDVIKAKNPVPSPANARWTVNDGSLQRSYDGGKTWEDVTVNGSLVGIEGGIDESSGSQAQADNKGQAVETTSPRFLAVATMGPEVWAGGSGGALYHTSDGGSEWTRVNPSAAAAVLTGDITDIRFIDPQHGRVATSTLELWITSDAGQTWLKQQ